LHDMRDRMLAIAHVPIPIFAPDDASLVGIAIGRQTEEWCPKPLKRKGEHIEVAMDNGHARRINHAGYVGWNVTRFIACTTGNQLLPREDGRRACIVRFAPEVGAAITKSDCDDLPLLRRRIEGQGNKLVVVIGCILAMVAS